MNEQIIRSTRKSKLQPILLAALALLTVAGLVTSFVFYNKYQDANSSSTKEISAGELKERNQEESDKVLNVLKDMIVFQEEDPTVVRIEDPTVLQESNPEFYKGAAADDYLVLFPSRAIVYRSSEEKIINIAPIINTNDIDKKADTESE